MTKFRMKMFLVVFGILLRKQAKRIVKFPANPKERIKVYTTINIQQVAGDTLKRQCSLLQKLVSFYLTLPSVFLESFDKLNCNFETLILVFIQFSRSITKKIFKCKYTKHKINQKGFLLSNSYFNLQVVDSMIKYEESRMNGRESHQFAR